VNSVEPPLAPRKQRRKVIPKATNDNHQLAVFIKAKHSQVSTRYSDQPTCQMPVRLRPHNVGRADWLMASVDFKSYNCISDWS
jgi:hypothetical protein